MKVKEIVNVLSLPKVVIVYDEHHEYLSWITDKKDKTLREILLEVYGENEVLLVSPYLDDFHGIIFEFCIKIS